MRIGLLAGISEHLGNTLPALEAFALEAEALGFDNLWVAHVFGTDALTGLALLGRTTRRIELASAVVPTWPRHPMAMAQQALTAAVACGGRFTLGIGLSHKALIEDMLGIPFDKPAGHMREYLEALRGDKVQHSGRRYRTSLQLNFPDAPRVPLMIAALGPLMLQIAGALSDGTITWMTGPNTLEAHTLPLIRQAAAGAGRPVPRVAAGFPILLTDDAEGARKAIEKQFTLYGVLPSYRAMLDREGLARSADIAIVGNEKTLRAAIARLRDIGIDDAYFSIAAPDRAAFLRTRAFLAGELASLR
jgi:5,10-methylenetetrahydromethanopterin reductase